jgi:hypothetical protein
MYAFRISFEIGVISITPPGSVDSSGIRDACFDTGDFFAIDD